MTMLCLVIIIQDKGESGAGAYQHHKSLVRTGFCGLQGSALMGIASVFN